MVGKLKDWTMDRKKERTTWDGILLVAMGVIVLMGSPFVKIGAWAAILWGVWTIWKSE